MAQKPGRFDPRQNMRRPDFELQHKLDSHLNDVELHHHDFYELYYLVSGDVTYVIESRLYKVLPGDVLLISPLELHQVHIEPEHTDYERYVLWIHPQLIRTLLEDRQDLFQPLDPAVPGHRNQLRLQPGDQQRIHALMEQLYREDQSGLPGEALLSRSLLTQLLITVSRLSQQEDSRFEDIPGGSSTVSQVVEYINLHYRDDLSLDSLAERFFVSKYHLSHEFRRQMGTTVCRYLQKKRLLMARHYLSQGKRPSDVYTLCGFADYTVFYRAFKAEYGISPREFSRSLTDPS